MDNNIENTTNQVITPNVSSLNTAPKKTKGIAAKVVALALCCSLVGGAAGAGGVLVLNRLNGTDTATVSTRSKEDSTMVVGSRDGASLKVTSADTSDELTASEIYANNVNSTVGITTKIQANYYGYQTEASSAGSGFILTDDGYIVTNYHVVDGATEIKVATYDNQSYDAKLIGYDESNDIAVLKIEAKGLTPVILGDSDDLNVGENVVAIGNPLGELSFSLTSGSVSALNRKVTVNKIAMNLIQTDCAINSGNSGGALFNSHGEVIGITNVKYSNTGDSTTASIDNIGFAIPINSVRSIITSIIEKGYIEKPYIGVSVYDLQSDYQNNIIQGAVVYEVEKDSPAEDAGLQKDDVITAVNGTKITGTADLRSILSQGSEGDKFTLTVYRDGETMKIKVVLGVRQQDALPDEKDNEKQDYSGQNNQGQGFPGWDNSNGGFPYQDDSNQEFPYQDDSNQGFPFQGDSDQGFPYQGGSDQGFPFQGNPGQDDSSQNFPFQGNPGQDDSSQNFPFQGDSEQQYQKPEGGANGQIPSN